MMCRGVDARRVQTRGMRCLVTFLLGVLCTSANAQPPGVAEPIWTVSADARTEYVLGGDADVDGTLDVLISDLTLRVDGPLWRGSSARLSLNWEERHYDAQDGFTLYPGRGLSFEDVHTVGVSGRIIQVLGRNWGVLVRGGVSGSAEVGAGLEDGVSWNVLAGAGYQCSESFRGGVGVLVLGRLEDDLIIVPAIQFDWRISDQWRMRLEGPSLEVTWRPHDDWLVGLSAGYDTLRTRLSDRSPTNGGILEDARLPVRLRVRHELTDAAWVQLSAGVDAWRRVEVEDDDGDRLQSSDMDPGLFFGVALGVTF